jgi:serine/threonine protein kinase
VRTEHVAQVFETGTLANGTPFLVMELLEGHDLGWHLRNTGRLPLKFVVALVEQVAHAVAAVRDAGIVHRDLKPGNLFLTDSIPPRWKVLDFGLSKMLSTTSSSSLTRDQAVGTPSYMAPEQVHAGDIDHLADLYALAAIAYRSITGSLPFSGDDVAHLLFKVLYVQPTQPALLVKVPVDVELVLAIGMAKRPADRFSGVEEFAKALSLAAAGDLDDLTRAKGWSLIKQCPWGSTRTARERMAKRPAKRAP